MRCWCAKKELAPRGHPVSGFLPTRPCNDPISPEPAHVIPKFTLPPPLPRARGRGGGSVNFGITWAGSGEIGSLHGRVGRKPETGWPRGASSFFAHQHLILPVLPPTYFSTFSPKNRMI